MIYRVLLLVSTALAVPLSNEADANAGSPGEYWNGIALPGTYGQPGYIYYPDSGSFQKSDNFGLPMAYIAPTTAQCGYEFIFFSGGRLFDICTREILSYKLTSNDHGLAGRMQQQRIGHAMICLDNQQLLLCGGRNRLGITDSCELCHVNPNYADNVTYLCAEAQLKLPQPLESMGQAQLDGVVYLVGGFGNSISLTGGTSVYKLVGNRFVQVSSLHVARYQPGTAVYNGQIYVCGGSNGTNSPDGTLLNDCETYDPKTDTWTQQQATMLHPRYNFGLFNYNDKLYAVGGVGSMRTGESLASVEQLVAGQWQAVQIQLPRPLGFTNVGVAVIS